MAVAFQSVQTTVVNVPATTVTVNVPVSTADGDLLLFGIHVETNVNAAVPLSGLGAWTVVVDQRDLTSNFDGETYLYYRVASSEPASYTVTWTTNRGGVFSILRYTGATNVTPLNTSAGLATTVSASTTGPAITVNATDMVVQLFGGSLDTSAGGSYTMAGTASWNVRVNTASTSAGRRPGLLVQDRVGVGTASTVTASGGGAATLSWADIAASFLVASPNLLWKPRL